MRRPSHPPAPAGERAWQVLTVLSCALRRRTSVSQLAARLGAGEQAVNMCLNRLHKRGFVRQVVKGGARRYAGWTITPAGRDELAELTYQRLLERRAA